MHRVLGAILLLAGALVSGCIGSDGEDIGPQSGVGDQAASWAREIPATITGLEHLTDSPLTGEKNGAGIWTHGDFAYVSGLSSGFHVVDVSDPQGPVVVGSISGDLVFSRDVDLLHYPGRTVAVLATQSGGMTFVDVTDPTDPTIVRIIEMDPNHNVAVVPGTHIVYNSPSTGEGRANEIVDASVPEQAEVVGEFGTFGCHDTSFYMDEDEGKYRAYCAGVDTSQIWDIADPLAPQLITGVSNPCMDDDLEAVPRSNCLGLHHSAFVNEDASILMLGDEFMGGGGPGCQLHAEPGGTSISTPIGALWFYDITDEENPELLSWFSPTIPVENHVASLTEALAANPTAAPFSLSCTSHFGELVPGKEMVVIGWYQAGVLLIDFSDPTNPLLVDQWNDSTAVWDARVHNGYIFTGDIARGLDVLTFAGG